MRAVCICCMDYGLGLTFEWEPSALHWALGPPKGPRSRSYQHGEQHGEQHDTQNADKRAQAQQAQTWHFRARRVTAVRSRAPRPRLTRRWCSLAGRPSRARSRPGRPGPKGSAARPTPHEVIRAIVLEESLCLLHGLCDQGDRAHWAVRSDDRVQWDPSIPGDPWHRLAQGPGTGAWHRGLAQGPGTGAWHRGCCVDEAPAPRAAPPGRRSA